MDRVRVLVRADSAPRSRNETALEAVRLSMRLLVLALANLRQNPRRTLLMSLSLAFSLFLFVSLVSVLVSLDQVITKVGENAVIAVIHRGGFTHDMPESHAGRIRAIEGVRVALPVTYYGGVYGDVVSPQDTFPSMALPTQDESRTIFGGDAKIADAEWRAWMADRTAALAGPQLMRRYGWKPGQRITLRGTLRRVDLTFTIVGTATFFTDQSNFLLHRDYLEESLGRPGTASLIFVKAESVAAMPAVIARINDTLGNSSDPVKAMSQKQLISSFLNLIGDVRGAVRSIAALVMIAVFFVTLNSMTLAARTRVPEVAVLKALGFSGRDVLVSMVTEGMIVGLIGGVAGALAAYAIFEASPLELGFGPLSGFQAPPHVVAAGIGVGVLLGMLAALLPAVRAARLSIVEALRRRD